MKKLLHTLGAGLVALWCFSAAPVLAQTTSAVVVAACGTPPTTYSAGQNRQVTQDTTGRVCQDANATIAGTVSENLAQVNGQTVNVGAGAAGTGTQRVTTSTDSTIGTVTTLTTLTGGGVASGAADSGNPVKVGARFNSTTPTFTDGQRGDLQLDARGSLRTSVCATGGGTCLGVVNPGNGTAASGSLPVLGFTAMFNGATWDNAFTCASSATVNVTAGATTQIVGLSSTTVIRVCSIAVSMSAAGSAGVYTGTGSNCGTGTTTLIQDMTLPTGTPFAISAPSGGSLVRSSAGGEICVKAVTGNVTGVITYAQF